MRDVFVGEGWSEHLQREWESLDLIGTRAPLTRCRFPLVLPSRSNSRGHSRWAGEKNKAQRQVGLVIGKLMKQRSLSESPWAAGFCVVRLVRVAPRPVDDDNAKGCLKCVRDGIADAFGIDDRDPRVRYVVDQAKGPAAVEAYLYARRAE